MTPAPLQPPKTRVELDELKCSVPNCPCDRGLYIVSPCHPSRGVRVEYQAGILTIRCDRCEALVERIAVASGTAADGGRVH